MSDIENKSVPVKIRERKLPDWFVDKNGEKQYRLRGGRWNIRRVAEFIVANPIWHTTDDIARVVYGTTSKKYRDNVRKHIPAQRNFMLHSLEQPIVTDYGYRGQIMRVKLYNQTDEQDRLLLKVELGRARDRKELSEQRYESLLTVFAISAQ